VSLVAEELDDLDAVNALGEEGVDRRQCLTYLEEESPQATTDELEDGQDPEEKASPRASTSDVARVSKRPAGCRSR
jgi:hypothetical protein